MKKTNKKLTQFITIGMLALFAFSSCDIDNSSGDDSSTDKNKGPKVTVHWQIPGAKETVEKTYADYYSFEYDFENLSKERDGYYLAGFKDKEPTAEDFSVVYDTDEKKTITEDIDIYAIWKKEKIVVTFYYKEASSSSTDVKTETMEATSAYNDFIFPDVNKETEEKACTSWAKSDGSYACEANSKKSLYDLSLSEYKLPSVYDESDMSYHAYCDFYEYWYNKSSMKSYFFNMNDCSSSKDLDNCEVKTINVSPYSKEKIDVSTLNLKREGYTLLGYSTNPVATFVSTSSNFDSGKTYYAIWSKDNGYITAYVKENKSLASSLEWERVETDGSNFRLSEGTFFTKDGYSLGGWNIEAHAKETWPHADELPGVVYDSKNLNPVNIWYARWVDETKFYANKGEISFYSDETKNEEEKITRSAYAYPIEYTVIASYSENCALVLPDCPFTKEGKTFSGWKNEKSNSIKQPGESVKFNANGSGFYGNIFVAVWE